MKVLLPFEWQSALASGTPEAVDDGDVKWSVTGTRRLNPTEVTGLYTGSPARESQATHSPRSARLIASQDLSPPPAPQMLEGRTAIPVSEQASVVDPNERRCKCVR